MSDVARVTEISARSADGFEDAVAVRVARAAEGLRDVTSASVKEQRVKVQDGRVVEYQVDPLVTSVVQ